MRNTSQMRWISTKDPENDKYYLVGMTPGQAVRYDNGMLVSCGLTVGEGNFTRKVFARLPKRPITKEAWNHSGCQSRCTLRGDTKCGW